MAWTVCHQPFVTHSSCEAELLSVTTGACFGEAFWYLVRDLLQREPLLKLFNDNQSAVSVFNDQGGSWRTRALKIRANYLKDRLSLKLYELNHVQGSENVADIGTKVLGGQRLKQLRQLAGLWSSDSHALPSNPAPAGGDAGAILRAVVMACCLCATAAQPQAPKSTFAWDQFASTVTVAIITIFCWEAAKYLYRRVCWRSRTTN